MENQIHIIKRQVIEAEFYDKKEAQNLFNQISDLFNTKLEAITNSLLDKTVSPDRCIKIEQLQLDMGTISYPIDYIEFAERYESALKKALTDYTTQYHPKGIYENQQEVSSYFISGYAQLLHYFLVNGVLPWRESEEKNNQPNFFFNKVLNENPERLKDLILHIGKDEYVRKRLVMQFGEAVIQDVIKLIEPVYANFIVQYHKEIISVHREKQLVQTQEQSFKDALWYFILTYLLVDFGGHFARKNFIKSTLTQMASHFNVTFESLLLLLTNTLEANTDLVQSHYSFSSYIKELKQELQTNHNFNKPNNNNTTVIDQKSLLDTYEALNYFLLFGSLPFEYNYYPIAKISLLLRSQIKEHPNQFIILLNTQSDIVQFVVRLMSVATESVLFDIIKIKEPSKTDFIIDYYYSTVKVQNKKSLAKVPELDFKKKVLQFILIFLFTKHDSFFNTKRFVEENVKQLGQHFNINYRTLLILLTQSIGQDYDVINNHSSLFFIFTEILGEEIGTDETANTKTVTGLNKEENKAIENTNNLSFVKDIVLFWFLHGSFPWWAKEVTSIPIAQLFQKLVDKEPENALLLLKQSLHHGIKESALIRIVSQPIIQLLKLLPDHKITLELLLELQELAVVLAEPALKANIKDYLLKGLLDTYHFRQFESFDVQLYYFLLTKYLNKITAIPKTTLVIQLNAILKKNNKPEFLELEANRIALTAINNIDKDEFLFLNEFDFLIDSNTVFDLSLTTLVDKAYEILVYFLNYNRLPDFIKIKNDAVLQRLIVRLVIIVFDQDRNLLNSLMQLDSVSAVAKMTIHQSFAKENNQQSLNVFSALKVYEEKDVLRYIKQIWKQEQTMATLNQVLHFIKAESSIAKQQLMHKEVLQLISVSTHYATAYTGAEFINLITLLSNKTLVLLVSDYVSVLNLAIKDSFEREKLLFYLRLFSFNWVAQANFKNSELFYSQFLVFLNQQKNWNIKGLLLQITNGTKTVENHVNSTLKATIITMIKETLAYDKQHDYGKNIVATAKDSLLKQSDYASLFVENKTEQSSEPTLNETMRLNEGEKIYISNAGLVLLHPFLSTLFQRTGLQENSVFVNDEAQVRALHLLQYLVDFSQENLEHDLVLNKLLCGMAYQEAIPQSVELTVLEKETANELLYAVTQQWEQLKNTSVNGFQTSFLQREGFLSSSEEGWTLVVENKAYDLLLQTLPWGLSFIKNSWMEQPIFVEWN